jgi:hypothetical protein
MMLSPA